MASDKTEQDDKKMTGPSMMAWLIILAALSLAAAGAGGGLGIMVFSIIEKHAMEKQEATPATEKVKHYATDEQVVMLPPVVTNLAAPFDTWVRMEGAVVFANVQEQSSEKLVEIIAGDILIFMRSLKLSQISGANGLLHLREDLTERARIRSDGKVSEIVVHSLVIE